MFSSDYRAGKGAEAAGDLVEASRRFAEAGADDALLRVVRKRAAMESDPRVLVQLRRQALEVALGWCPDKPEARTCKTELARAMLRLCGVVEPEEQKELARQAGTLLQEAGDQAEAGDLADAGRALEQIGDFEQATEAYIQAGDLEAVERTAALGSGGGGGPQVELKAWVEVLLDQGKADEAVEAVAEAEREGKPEAREARALLDATLPAAGRLVLSGPSGTFRLVSDEVAEVGRDPGVALVLSVQSLSRRHLSLQRSGDALIVANLSSTGTVTVAGESLLAPKVVEPTETEVRISLDGGCELVALRVGTTWRVKPMVSGLVGDTLVLGATVELEGLSLACDGRFWRCDGATVVRGQQLGPFTAG